MELSVAIKIENKYKCKIARKNLPLKKRLENIKVAKEEKKKIENRGNYNSIELYDYEDYYKYSNDNAKYLTAFRPTIVKTL